MRVDHCKIVSWMFSVAPHLDYAVEPTFTLSINHVTMTSDDRLIVYRGIKYL